MKNFCISTLILMLGLSSCDMLAGKSDFQTKCFSSKQAIGEYNREMEYSKMTSHRQSKYAIKIGEGLIKIYDAEHDIVWRQDSVHLHHEKNGTYYFESIDPSYERAPANYSHTLYILDNQEKTLSEISTPFFGKPSPLSNEIIYYID
jgi:hypothetical protein